MIKKADIILFILIIAAGLMVSLSPLVKEFQGTDVRVTVDGELYGIYDLNSDQTIEISRDGHTNVVVIESGTVRMESSSCKNQICVEHGKISHGNDSIVCLPNRVVVEIDKQEGGEADVISD